MTYIRIKNAVKYVLNWKNKGNEIAAIDQMILLENMVFRGIPNFLNFSFDILKENTLAYVESNRIGNSMFEYKFSQSCSEGNIYSSMYACLIQSLYGRIETLGKIEKSQWAEYFNMFQNESDGLFYDKSIHNELYENCDWWGAKHLTLHLISAFRSLGYKPKYAFSFLEEYYSTKFLKTWLDRENWSGKFSHDNDIDNKLMNIVSMLQYQRDFLNDQHAAKSVNFIQKYLLNKVNKNTGMWGNYDINDKEQLSRMVQFYYHLLPIFLYDSIDLVCSKRVIDLTLLTQNELGGFGAFLNSSACEDMDSVDILIKFSRITDYKRKEINVALNRSLIWILSNQNDDGGFVFKRNVNLYYGHQQMSCEKNESSLFPTWFRTLSIAYISNHFGNQTFKIVNSPGFFE